MNTNKISSVFESLEKNASILNNHLNNISNNLKDLEKKLQSLHIGICTELDISKSECLSPIEKELYNIREIQGWEFVSSSVTESITWERDEKSNKFRLHFKRAIIEERVAKNQGYVQDGEFTTVLYASKEFPDGISFKKPLLECGSDIRLKVWESIPEFLNCINNEVSKKIENNNSIGGL